MAEINGIKISDAALEFLRTNNKPNTENIEKLGSKDFYAMDADLIKFYSDFLIQNYINPSADDTNAEEQRERFAVLNAYADILYPGVSPQNSPEKRNFIAKLDNGLRSFVLTSDIQAIIDIQNARDEAAEAQEQAEREAEAQRQAQKESAEKALSICLHIPQFPECSVDVVSGSGSTGKALPDDVVEGDVDIVDELGILSTSTKPVALNNVKNSWIIAWEPTQQIGIVKVPLTKLLTALNTDADEKKKEFLLSYNDALLFETNGLIDFKQVTKRVFLPLSSNKLVLLKEFTMVRKNVQQTELTHGSKYFQVFTEAFPEFSLSLEASKFADIAKKVKLFFDNVMKRISETNRYSGSLYLYDVLSSEILTHSVTELNQLIASGNLIRYRLLPRSLKMATTADEPNMLKITIDGIIVEWERQTQRMNIPLQGKPPATAAAGSSQGQSGSSAVNEEPKLIGPQEKYSQLFVNLDFTGADGKPPTYKSRIIQQDVGNRLWAQEETANFLRNSVSLWFIDEYVKEDGKYTLPQYEDSFTRNALNEIYRDTRGLYSQIASFLSNNFDNAEDDKSNFYNRILAEAMNDLGIGVGASGTSNGPDLKRKFREGFERYIDLVRKPVSLGGEGKSGDFIRKFSEMFGPRN